MARFGPHLICPACWTRHYANENTRDISNDPELNIPEPCCWCGAPTGHGYYVRADADTISCPHPDGEHP